MAFWNARAQAARIFGFGQVRVDQCDVCKAVNTLEVDKNGNTKCTNCGTTISTDGVISTDTSAIDWNRHL